MVLTPVELRLFRRWVGVEDLMRRGLARLDDERWWSAVQGDIARVHRKLLREAESGRCCDGQRAGGGGR